MEDYSNPYEMVLNLNTDNQKRNLQVNVGLEAASYGEDVHEAVSKTVIPSVDEIKAQKVESMNEDKALVRKMVVEDAALNRKDLLPTLIQETQMYGEEDKANASKELTPYIADIYHTPGSENMTEEEVKGLAVNALIKDTYAKAMDEQGGFEFGLDLLNMMFVPDISYNQAQMSEEQDKFVAFMSTEESIKKQAEAAMRLDPEDRLLYYKSLSTQLEGLESSVIQRYISMLEYMGEDQDTEASAFFDKAFIAEYGVGIFTKLFKGLKAFNIMRSTSKAGNINGAALAADIASKDAKLASAMGVDQFDASMAGNPIKNTEGLSDVFRGAPEGPSAAYRNRLVEIDRNLEEAERTVGSSIPLSDLEKREFAAKYADTLSGDPDIEVLDFKATESGVQVTYKGKDGEVTAIHDYDLDSVGGFVDKTMKAWQRLTLGRAIWSPAIKSGADKNIIVDAAVKGLYASNKAQARIDEALVKALKPVKTNSKSFEKVQEMLFRLDGEDIDPTYQQLVNEGVGGLRLTPKEFEVVTGVRHVLDVLWRMNNTTQRREMMAKGIRVFKSNDHVHYAKPYADSSSAYTQYANAAESNVVLFMQDGRKTIDTLTKKALDKAYDEGYVLLKSDEEPYNWFRAGDNHAKFALVKKEGVNSLPEQVTNKIPNYLPKSNQDASYFIKRIDKKLIDGKRVDVEKTVAWAKSKTQADDWIDRALKVDPTTKFAEPRFDREAVLGIDSPDAVNMKSGGLYRGKRASTELVYAGDAVDGKRTDALTALRRYTRFTSDRMNMSLWRMGMRQRVINDVKAVDHTLAGVSWDSLSGAISDSKVIGGGQRQKLLAAIDQINSVSFIPTKLEAELQGAVIEIGKYLDKNSKKVGGFKDNLAQAFYANKKADAFGVARSAAFDLTLGAFNIAQMPVQAASIAAALAANPIHFTKGFPKALVISALDFAGGLTKSRYRGEEVLARMTKDLGLDAKSLRNDYKFWKDSGMYEAVIRGDADAASAMGRLPYDAGVISRTWEKARDIGRVPYAVGDLASMRYSFMTALEREKGLAGNAFKYDEATLERVVARAEDYRLNMSAGNKANYQRGFWSLPAQFKSIYTKSLEAYLGNSFNGAEKSRIALAQFALYGTAGIPVLNYFSDSAIDMLFDVENMNEAEILQAKRGVVGWFINGYMDIDALVSERLAIAPNFLEDVKDILQGNTSLPKAALGATFTTIDKTVDVINNAMMAGKLILNSEDITPELLNTAGGIVGRALANMPTSGRRAMEAYLMYAFQEKRTTDGTTLYQLRAGDSDAFDIFARAAGFASQDFVDVLDLKEAAGKKRSEAIRNKAQFYSTMLNNLMFGVDRGSEAEVAAIQTVLSMFKTAMEKESLQDSTAIWDNINSNLENQDLQDSTFLKALDNSNSELVKSALQLNPYYKKALGDITEPEVTTEDNQ